VPISVSELLDKISILELKAAAITGPEKRANVTRELAAPDELRRREVMPSPVVEALYSERSGAKASSEARWGGSAYHPALELG